MHEIKNLILEIINFLDKHKSNKNEIVIFNKLKTLRILRILLTVSFVSLFLTAVVPMNRYVLHRISASGFFLTYNFFVFFFGISRSLKYLRKGLLSIFIGALMLLSSLLLIPFPSYGVFEIVYILLIILWNANLFYKRVIKEDSHVN